MQKKKKKQPDTIKKPARIILSNPCSKNSPPLRKEGKENRGQKQKKKKINKKEQDKSMEVSEKDKTKPKKFQETD